MRGTMGPDEPFAPASENYLDTRVRSEFEYGSAISPGAALAAAHVEDSQRGACSSGLYPAARPLGNSHCLRLLQQLRRGTGSSTATLAADGAPLQTHQNKVEGNPDIVIH